MGEGPFLQDGADQTQAGSLLGKNTIYLCATVYLLVNPPQTVGHTDSTPVFCRKREDGQTFRKVLFHPVSQARSGFGVLLDRFGQVNLGSSPVCGVENGVNVVSHFGQHIARGA